jgi:cytochrome P450
MYVRIPGPTGLDHLAYIHDFTRWPYDTLRSLSDRYGAVFSFGLAPFRLIYLIGPEANQFVMTDKDKNFRWREAYDLLVPIGGEAALIVSDGEPHRRRRQLVQSAFHRTRIEGYFDGVVNSTNEVLDSWYSDQTLDIYQVLRSAVLHIVTKSLFGANLANQASILNDNLDVMLRFINLWPWFQVRINLPGFPWRKVKEARHAIDAIVYSEILRRRSGSTTDDLLTLLIHAHDENQAPLPDVEVRDLVVSLITAGYDTTSATLGWLMCAMLRDLSIWERARAEYKQVVGDRPLACEDLPQLKYLDWVISETLRVYSPAFLGVRKAVCSFTFHGHRIPANSIVAYSPYVTHHLADIWPDPGAFRPERWDANSIGYRAPGPYEYVPFGGGARRCLGESFALMELKVMLGQILNRVTLSLISQDTTPTGFSAMHPKEGVWVRVNEVRG